MNRHEFSFAGYTADRVFISKPKKGGKTEKCGTRRLIYSVRTGNDAPMDMVCVELDVDTVTGCRFGTSGPPDVLAVVTDNNNNNHIDSNNSNEVINATRMKANYPISFCGCFYFFSVFFRSSERRAFRICCFFI